MRFRISASKTNIVIHQKNRMRKFFLILWAGAALVRPAIAEQRLIPPAFGTNVHLSRKDFADSKSFKSNERIVGTYYFYWYDVETKSHVIDYDGTDALTTHPPTLENFSYKSVAWHKKQLRDVGNSTSSSLKRNLCSLWMRVP